MRGYITSFLLGAIILLGGLAAYYHRSAGIQRDRAIAAESRAAGLVRANEALQTYIVEAETERDRWQRVAQELETVEGRDEPLNDYERAVLDRVRSP